jgi:V8-like Glu-specific endopeptidase
MTGEKRSIIGLAAIVAMLAMPAVAQADQVAEAPHVARTAAEVSNYWTPKRMENAKPAPLLTVPADDGSSPTPVAAPPVTAFELTDTLSFPNRVHGKVFFTKPAQPPPNSYVCSGTAVLASNDSTVITAGHCVNDSGVWSTNFAFVPGYRNGSAPYGVWAASDESAPSGWVGSGNFRYDVGAAVMARNSSGQELEDVVGGRGILFNQSTNQQFRSHGYPQAAPFDGSKLYACDAATTFPDNPSPAIGPSTMGIACDMTGGSSGGGWVVTDGSGNGYVESVNSYKYPSTPAFMFGPYFGDVIAALYSSIESEPPGVPGSPTSGTSSSPPTSAGTTPLSNSTPKKCKKSKKRKKKRCKA